MLAEYVSQNIQKRVASSDVLLVLGECWSALAPVLGLDSRVESSSQSSQSRAQSVLDSAQNLEQNPAPHVICLHPIFDTRVANAHSSSLKLLQQQYEIGAELGVAVLLFKVLEPHISSLRELPAFLREFLDELDVGYIASESALAEEELETLAQILAHAKHASIVVGASFFSHPHAELIARILCAIGQLAGIGIIPLDYGDTAGSLIPMLESSTNSLESILDSSDTAEILGRLAMIEEANGAYVYCSLLPQADWQADIDVDSACADDADSLPVLFASAGFLRLMKLAPDTQANLRVDFRPESTLQATGTIACRVIQAPYLQGALAVLDMAHLAHERPELARRYPFIKAHFVQADSATQALEKTLGNGGHHG